jgi:TonB-dependent starch-binding outer membrane protein SusC
LYFLWDWAQGGNTVNLSRFLSDLGGVTVDGPAEWKLRDDMRRGRGAFAGNPQTPWVEDATAFRLREVNLSYNFNRDLVYSIFGDGITSFRVGLTARNVLLFTKYSGYDPEVSNFGNIAVGGNIEVTPFPSTRSVFFNIALGF